SSIGEKPVCGVSRMSHGRLSRIAKLVSNCFSSGLVVYLNVSFDTGERLSAYTTSRQRVPSHERQDQLVPPAVWPGVRCAVTRSGPTVSVSPFRTTVTDGTASNGSSSP